MAKGMKIKITGIKATQAFLISKIVQINKDIEEGIKEAGAFIKDEVKASIEGKRSEPRSVDTGEFRDSVDVITSKTTATIFSDVKQAKSLEYGTSRIRARRHFNNSKDRNKSKIVQIIKSKL